MTSCRRSLSLDLFGLLLFFHRLQEEKESHRVFLDSAHQVLEQLEGFLLVLHERIALAIAAQADAFLEMIHRKKVILPVRIHDLQHDHAFVISHRSGADDGFLLRRIFRALLQPAHPRVPSNSAWLGSMPSAR